MPGDDEDFLEQLPVQGDDDEELQDLPDDDIGDDEDDQSGGDGGEEHPAGADNQEAGRGTGDGLEVRRSRGASRIEAATRIAAEAKARAEAAEARLAEIERRSQTQDQQAQRERERIAFENMDPLERVEFNNRRLAETVEARLARIEQQNADSADRAAFAAKCARDPRLAKVADEVEAALAGSRANGVTVPRETVAAYIIGNKFMSAAPKARKQQAAAGAARVAGQQARPGAGRSDSTTRAGLSEREARLERLRNAEI